MEFCIGLFSGIAVGVVATIISTASPQTKADKHVELLNAKAQKDLEKLQQSRNQIAQVSLKADGAHRELRTKISDLASQG
jgi:hypothetical protein